MTRLLYEITHSTSYTYAAHVATSHHLLRLTPRRFRRQACLAFELQLSPQPGMLRPFDDYFGNRTHFLGIESSHSDLEIRSFSRVAVAPAFIPEATETPSWERVQALTNEDHSSKALEAHEFTYPSPLVPIESQFKDYAETSFTPDRPVMDAVKHLTNRIHTDFKFDPSATTVATPVKEVFKTRRGVCQDFVHLQLACLRAYGVPSRYVSGYIETDPPRGHPKLRGVDASHAWLSFLCPSVGWVDVDPTNNCFPSLRHIAVAWGRDYSDVAPVRGVRVGSPKQTLQVAVDVVARGPLEEFRGDGQEISERP